MKHPISSSDYFPGVGISLLHSDRRTEAQEYAACQPEESYTTMVRLIFFFLNYFLNTFVSSWLPILCEYTQKNQAHD